MPDDTEPQVRPVLERLTRGQRVRIVQHEEDSFDDCTGVVAEVSRAAGMGCVDLDDWPDGVDPHFPHDSLRTKWVIVQAEECEAIESPDSCTASTETRLLASEGLAVGCGTEADSSEPIASEGQASNLASLDQTAPAVHAVDSDGRCPPGECERRQEGGVCGVCGDLPVIVRDLGGES